MKLLFITHSKYLQPMEAHRVFRYLGDEMQRRGHTVHYFLERGCTQQNSFSTLTHAISIAPFIGRMTQKKGYDFLICPGDLGWCLSTFRHWLLPDTTHIVSWHAGHASLADQAESHTGIQQFYRGLHRWSNHQALKTQSLCLINSHWEAEQLRQRFPTEAPKIAYLPTGVSSQFYYAERYHQRESATPYRLLWVGPWSMAAASHVATAWQQLQAKHPQLQLSLLNTQQSAEAILHEFPPETHSTITISPSVDENALIDAYRNHQFFLMPAQTQSTPLALLEAMASALPVVASQLNGTHPLITHYENGMLIPPNDANALEQTISHLIENPHLCRQLGESAYDTVSHYYAWSQIGDIFEGQLSRLL